MAKVITIINQKGGVAKSTTAEYLGDGLMRRGHRVLFIDLDAQGNLSYSLQADRSGAIPNSSLEVLTGARTAQEAIQDTPRGEVIAGSPALNGADLAIVSTGKEYRLKEALDPLKDNYDYIIIDTPPALGIRTVNALTASDGAIIPANTDIYSLHGIAQLNETIKAVQKYTNKDLKIMGVLVTRYDTRTTLSEDVTTALAGMAEKLNTKVYDTKIRDSVAVKKAQVVQKSIFEYSPSNNVAKDYDAFIEEILEDEING